jgi:hypothetical protein
MRGALKGMTTLSSIKIKNAPKRWINRTSITTAEMVLNRLLRKDDSRKTNEPAELKKAS